MYVVGIDPGARKNIGVAIVKADFSYADAFVVASVEELKEVLKPIAGDVIQAYVEQPSPVVKNGKNGRDRIIWNAPLVRAFGEIRGLLYGLDISCVAITAQKWQRKFFGPKKGRQHNKACSLQEAKRLFPKLSSSIGRNHNIADALLIAEYGRRYILKAEVQACGKGQS